MEYLEYLYLWSTWSRGLPPGCQVASSCLQSSATPQALQGGGVGVLGQSKGGDLALALAVTLGSKVASFLVPVSSPASSSSQIRAVATLNGCIASAGGSITHSGRTVFRGLGLHPHCLPRPRLDGSLDFLGAMQVGGTDGETGSFLRLS